MYVFKRYFDEDDTHMISGTQAQAELAHYYEDVDAIRDELMDGGTVRTPYALYSESEAELLDSDK